MKKKPISRSENSARAEARTRARSPESDRDRTMNLAIKLLARRSRSVAELREALSARASASDEIVEEIIARLAEYGYLNDEQFATVFAANRVRQRPVGRRRLERELELKQVTEETAQSALDQVFEELPEEALIDRAIEGRIAARGRPRNRTEAKSLFDYLIRRGFPYDLVISKVCAATAANLGDEDSA